MSGIREFFMNTFVPLCEQTEEADVNISTLIESSKNWSPILLHYGDLKKSEKDLAAAIIFNFCDNYALLQKYPKIGIQTLNNIIRNTLDVDVIAQQMLLVHITKMRCSVNMSVFFFVQINNMKLIMDEPLDEQNWKELAKKVIQHKQINDIINKGFVDFDLVPASTGVDKGNIKISFVKNVTTLLRGFSGFNEIFINADHFHNKIDGFKGGAELLQLIAKIDIISVALREYCLLRIRKHTGDFNMSIPIVKKLRNVKPNEFRMYNETKEVNICQVDWFTSAEQNLIQLDVNYIERYIKSIENGTMLPTGSIRGAVPRFQSLRMGGADFELSNDVY